MRGVIHEPWAQGERECHQEVDPLLEDVLHHERFRCGDVEDERRDEREPRRCARRFGESQEEWWNEQPGGGEQNDPVLPELALHAEPPSPKEKHP